MASMIYELVGRVVVRMVWFQYGRQIKMAGAGMLVAAVGGAYLISKREPPEG